MMTPERTEANPLNRDVLLWALHRGLRSHLKVATAREIEQLQPVAQRLRNQASQSGDPRLCEAVEALYQQMHQGGTGPQPYYADDLFDASLAATEAGDAMNAVFLGVSAWERAFQEGDLSLSLLIEGHLCRYTATMPETHPARIEWLRAEQKMANNQWPFARLYQTAIKMLNATDEQPI